MEDLEEVVFLSTDKYPITIIPRLSSSLFLSHIIIILSLFNIVYIFVLLFVFLFDCVLVFRSCSVPRRHV